MVVVTPLTETTRDMFGEEAFASMKPTAYLINTGAAAWWTMTRCGPRSRMGRSPGAALDVFEAEPLPEDSPLAPAEPDHHTASCGDIRAL